MMIDKGRKKTFLIILVVGLMLTVFLSTAIGPANIPLFDVGNAFLSKIPGLSSFASPVPSGYETIIFHIRLPRILLGVLVGAGLAVAGAALQALFRNPMADPYILGISFGAALGATIAVMMPITLEWFGVSFMTIMAFFGALIAVYIVYTISKVGGKVPIETLLLAGLAVGALLSAVTMTIMLYAGESAQGILFWMAGGLLASGKWVHVGVALPCVIIGVLVLYLFARELNVMLAGEEPARHLGVEVETMKKIILAASAFVAAAVVSISGLIAFVGLVIPHMMRILVGPDHRVLIPACLLAGSILIVSSDTVARIVVTGGLPVGVITAIFGAPFFIYLLRKRKRAMF